MNGRPGSSGPSRTLTDFTLARYVRIRLRRLRLLPEDEQYLSGGSLLPSSSDGTTLRRYFYSLRDITIGGQCPCNGHASECSIQHKTMVLKFTSYHLYCYISKTFGHISVLVIGNNLRLRTMSVDADTTLVETYAIVVVRCIIRKDGDQESS